MSVWYNWVKFLRPPRLCWRNFAVTQRRRRHSQLRKARKATSVAKIFRNGKLLPPFHTAMRSEVVANKQFIDSSQRRSYKTVTEVKFWFKVGRECRVRIFRVQTNIFANATLLVHPDPMAQLNITCDASDVAVGGVLQQYLNGMWQPLSFFSQKLSPAETRYIAFDS